MTAYAPPDTLPETADTTQREKQRNKPYTIQELLRMAGSFFIIAALAFWAILTYSPPVAPYWERAAFLFPLLILLADLGASWTARRALLGGQQSDGLQTQPIRGTPGLALPKITLPLYLACAILLGVQTAVLAALIIESILQIMAIRQRSKEISPALYRVATNGLVVLAGGGSYRLLIWTIGLPLDHPSLGLSLAASVLAALAMLLFYPLTTLSAVSKDAGKLSPRHWAGYFKTSEARFQLLLLSIGPLLPLADKLDDLEQEVAWVMFLVPLFAIYYLAIVSLRLKRQAEELQASLQALRQARQRQAELQDYAALVIRAQEDERRRLSRELHDDTAQALIALSRGLEALADARSIKRSQADDARWVADLRQLADRSLESVRRACRDLRPSVLDDLGLAAALDWLAQSSAQRGLPCALRIEGAPFPVPGESELVFFRIAQEALTNAWRHAHASQAEILLAYEPGRLRLRVQDNGQAFDLAQGRLRQERGGLGLLGMRERAALVGAELNITSTPGQGTAVEVRLALPISSQQPVLFTGND